MMTIKKHYIYNDNFTLNVLDLNQIELATKEEKAYKIILNIKSNNLQIKDYYTGINMHKILIEVKFHCNSEKRVSGQDIVSLFRNSVFV